MRNALIIIEISRNEFVFFVVVAENALYFCCCWCYNKQNDVNYIIRKIITATKKQVKKGCWSWARLTIWYSTPPMYCVRGSNVTCFGIIQTKFKEIVMSKISGREYVKYFFCGTKNPNRAIQICGAILKSEFLTYGSYIANRTTHIWRIYRICTKFGQYSPAFKANFIKFG